MVITTERAQELLQKYAQFKETIIKIDNKYSLSYKEPNIDFPPLELEKLQFVPLTEQQMLQQAKTLATDTYQTRLASCNLGYEKQRRQYLHYKADLQESTRQKLNKLWQDYNVELENLRRRLVNNGIVFSSMNTNANAKVLQAYNDKVQQVNLHHENATANIDADLEALQTRYNQQLDYIEEQFDALTQDQLVKIRNDQQEEKLRVDKYNATIDEKVTKYEASCLKSIQYARQAEYDRSLQASKLYAELGESGVEGQKMSEKFNSCKFYFMDWKKQEALYVIESDGFLNGHLGNYYQALIDWVQTTLPSA